ncbi:MAG: 50S ribosomal protein L4 [Candidatus Eremiobacteraeota bacterium]|nr:50S ribosomal protein L4 [Candidatus Eremiobacteraeota bacterium]MBV8204954.1 50S ribosomal protein L4 [Candidatus Eremiobacteraeota bacterium]MBV8262993.1 50S ribosomal protein L4 [Candidatus Eremiobacteraeota bacterium]MBV8667821.1 50S ribosomal protein L4 [Candidatus Eremiobacteraeota bacterium]
MTPRKSTSASSKSAKSKSPSTDALLQALEKDALPETLAREPKLSVMHEAVVRQLANRRAGTADTKKRDEVSGGGRKPWRQKGTGRARQGSIRSPQWRKGGIVFGPHPRSFALAMNKKTRRSALAMALATKAQAESLFVIDAAKLSAAKTKELHAVLWPQHETDSVLLVMHAGKDEAAGQVRRAGRNLRRAAVIGHDGISAHTVLAHDRVIVSRNALDALAEVGRG